MPPLDVSIEADTSRGVTGRCAEVLSLARAESLTRQLGRSFRRCHRSTAGCLTSGEIAEKLEPLLKGFEAAKAAPAVVKGLAFKLRQLLEEWTG